MFHKMCHLRTSEWSTFDCLLYYLKSSSIFNFTYSHTTYVINKLQKEIFYDYSGIKFEKSGILGSSIILLSSICRTQSLTRTRLCTSILTLAPVWFFSVISPCYMTVNIYLCHVCSLLHFHQFVKFSHDESSYSRSYYRDDDNSVFNRFWSQMIFMPTFEEDVGSSDSRQAKRKYKIGY